MKRLEAMILVGVVALLLSDLPARAAMKALSEQELDLTTANSARTRDDRAIPEPVLPQSSPGFPGNSKEPFLPSSQELANRIQSDLLSKKVWFWSDFMKSSPPFK